MGTSRRETSLLCFLVAIVLSVLVRSSGLKTGGNYVRLQARPDLVALS